MGVRQLWGLCPVPCQQNLQVDRASEVGFQASTAPVSLASLYTLLEEEELVVVVTPFWDLLIFTMYIRRLDMQML